MAYSSNAILSSSEREETNAAHSHTDDFENTALIKGNQKVHAVWLHLRKFQKEAGLTYAGEAGVVFPSEGALGGRTRGDIGGPGHSVS